MYKHILVPTDGSARSARAVKVAVTLAAQCGARLTVFHAVAPFTAPEFSDGTPIETGRGAALRYVEALERAARRRLDPVAERARESGVACRVELTTASPAWPAILAAVRRGRCDLIVMASHGRHGVSGVLLGSETTSVLTHSRVPVLVIR